MDTLTVPELVVPFSVAVMMMTVPLVNALATTARSTVAAPLLSVVADVEERAPPDVAVKLTVTSLFAVPSAFLTVAVIVDVPPAVELMVVGLATTVTSGLKATTTLPEAVPAEAVTVKLPVLALVRVAVAVPPVVVVEKGARVPPVVTRETVVPSATAVPLACLTLTVMVTEVVTRGEAGDAVTVTDVGASAAVSGNHSTSPQPAHIIATIARIQTALPINPP